MFTCCDLSFAFGCERQPGRSVFHIHFVKIALPREHHSHTVIGSGIRGIFDRRHLRTRIPDVACRNHSRIEVIMRRFLFIYILMCPAGFYLERQLIVFVRCRDIHHDKELAIHLDDLTQLNPRPGGVKVDKGHVPASFLFKVENRAISLGVVDFILVGILGSDFGKLVEGILALRLLII